MVSSVAIFDQTALGTENVWRKEMLRVRSRKRLEMAIVFLGCLLFAGAYRQLPLFSSNQNTYFLWGLARAGYGFLSSDWLASQTDPVPVFSAIVSTIHRFDVHWIFYLLHGCLSAVYAWSLVTIVRYVLRGRSSPAAIAVAVVILTHVHAGWVWDGWVGFLPESLERVLRMPLWVTPVLTKGVAQQYVLGPILQPSAFGVLLLASVALFTRKRELLAILCAAAAAAIHATYLLQAGILCGGFLVALILARRPRDAMRLGLVALAVLIPIAAFALVRLGPSDIDTLEAAQSILFSSRMPQHADLSVWLNDLDARRLALITLGIGLLWRRERLRAVFVVTFTAALVLTGLQVLSGSRGLALLFPWRASVWLVPAATAVVAGRTIGALDRVAGARLRASVRSHMSRYVVLISVAFAIVACVQGIRSTLSSIENHKSAGAVARVVGSRASSGQIYLVPPDFKRFRLEAGVPIFVDRKSHPYRDVEIVDWYKRLTLAAAFYEASSGADALRALDEIAKEFRITHVVAGESVRDVLANTTLGIVYEDSDYAVFEVTGSAAE